MKKLFAIILAVAMLASMATVVSAAETTTLTVTVLPAEYTLNIPESQKISYGEDCVIGNVTVSESSSFAKGKNLKVAVEYDGLFTCESVTTTIPYELMVSPTGTNGGHSTYKATAFPSGSTLTFTGTAEGVLNEKARETFETHDEQQEPGKAYVEGLVLSVASENWGKALAGDYTTTITFTAEVVVE